jgi:hypothetical protein
MNYFYFFFFLLKTSRIDAVNDNLSYYPAGLLMNNGEFLATYKKGSDTFYNKKNC